MRPAEYATLCCINKDERNTPHETRGPQKHVGPSIRTVPGHHSERYLHRVDKQLNMLWNFNEQESTRHELRSLREVILNF